MITNVQWDNDPILGNLNLSFTRDRFKFCVNSKN